MNLQTFFLLQRHYNNCWTQWFVWLIVYIMTLNPRYQHVQRIFNLFCNVTVWTFWNNNKNQVHGYLQNFRIEMKEWVSSLMITYSLYLNWHWCDRFVPNQSQTRLVNKNLILAKHMLGCKRKTNMNQDTTLSLRFM